MNRFAYLRPASLSEAIAAAGPGTAFLGAGTNLLDRMKCGIAAPTTLIDITRLPGLSTIEPLANGDLRIGALVRNADLAFDSGFAASFPMVAEALLAGASPQLRNAATIGGNVLQSTRCAYYFDPASACNRRLPGSGCDARGGDNRLHAVLGWSEACIATHLSDLCVPLAALGAIAEIHGAAGAREVAIGDLHRLPGDTPAIETELEPDELIIAVRLPAASKRFAEHSRYIKLRERTSYAFALVSAAAALDLDDGTIREARIALGGVAAKPWRAAAAEAVLRGAPANRESFERAAAAALAQASPSGDNGFKIELARRIVVRALLRATAGKPDRLPALPGSPFAVLAGEIDRG